MKYLIGLLIVTHSLAGEVFVTMSKDKQKKFFPNLEVTISKELSTFKVDEAYLPFISAINHRTSNYCGGFVTSEKLLTTPTLVPNFNNYTINRGPLISSYLSQVSETNLYNFIDNFSSYYTRYYLSQSGIKALRDLYKKWKNLVAHRNDVEVVLLKHKKWPQPSVILTFKGQTSQKIIVGGHADSINTDDEGVHSRSPGADDNASGISVITETIRILAENNYRPVNDIVFMAYAAEEVGLRGSMEIANSYSQKDIKVKGVLQIDGTNYNKSRDKIVLINDYTNKDQNRFIGRLIDKYIQVPWGYDYCQYACSDHYSWTYNGFISSFPAEAYIKEENPKIHTADDTLEVSNNSARHSVYFTKLALSYVIELDK